MNYYGHTGSIPPGSSGLDKPGLYTPGGFAASPYSQTQAGLSQAQQAQQAQRYPQSVTQAYAMSANPAYYTPPTASYPSLQTTPGYPAGTPGSAQFAAAAALGYPTLQSLPTSTPAGYPSQYPTYLGASQLGSTTSSYPTTALPVTSAIYPSSAYTNTPIPASQIPPRGYPMSAMYPSQLGSTPTYPGATYQPQPPF